MNAWEELKKSDGVLVKWFDETPKEELERYRDALRKCKKLFEKTNSIGYDVKDVEHILRAVEIYLGMKKIHEDMTKVYI